MIIQNRLVSGCNLCLEDQVLGNGDAAKHKREWDKKEYRGDTLQPVPSQARDFVRRYGERAKDWGFSDDQIRKLS